MEATTADVSTVALMIATTTVLVAIVGSSLMVLSLLLRQISRLDDKFTGELKEFRGEVGGEFKEVRGEFKEFRGEVGGEFKEVRGELSEFRGEVRGELSEFRGEVRGEVKEVRGELSEMRGESSEMRGESGEQRAELKEHGRRLDELAEGARERGRILGEVRERLARMEGHLLAPEGFTLRRHPSQASETQIPDDPPTDHREAG